MLLRLGHFVIYKFEFAEHSRNNLKTDKVSRIKRQKFDFMKWPRKIGNFTNNFGLPVSSIISTLNTKVKRSIFS